MIEGVVANVLAHNPTIVTAGIPEYTGGANGLAIFAVKVPLNCKSLAIKVQSISMQGMDTQGKDGFVARLDISIYGPKDYSYIPLRDIGMLIYKALHRGTLAPYIEAAGYRATSCFANPPSDHEDADGYPGCIVSLAATVLEI